MNADTISVIVSFIPAGEFYFIGRINKTFFKEYKRIYDKTTHLSTAVEPSTRLTEAWNDLPRSTWVSARIAEQGNLLWLHIVLSTFPVDGKVIALASQRGHFHVLRWFRQRHPIPLPNQ